MVRKVPQGRPARASTKRCGWFGSKGYEKRKPSQLSGGQRQRVALARALVNRPRVLLLDEPLGALDLKLREEMQIELKAIQQQVGITFIYVTHDQDEALTMSDRLAVFNQGRIEQVGAPGRGLRATGDGVRGRASWGRRTCSPATSRNGSSASRGTFTVRPEKIHIAVARRDASGRDESSATGTIRDVVYLGPDTRYIVALDAGTELVVTQQNLAHVLDRGAGPARQRCPPRLEATAPAPRRGRGVILEEERGMHTRKILALLAGTALAGACSSGGSSSAP